ncbi:MAG: NAD(P)/FAD-dependent oxidoreductase [archaeon]|nr:NAD(P)/FAD-dependent oxidoreductase [archaeon]
MLKNIVIVGAGPAGSYAAQLAAEKGMNVRVFEAKKKVLPAKCGEGIWKKKLVDSGINPEDSYPLTKLKTLKLGIEDAGKVEYTYIDIDEYFVLNRQKFEQSMIDNAKKNGAQFEFQTRLKNLDKISNDFFIGAYGITNFQNIPAPELVVTYQFDVENVDIEMAKTVIFSTSPYVRYIYVFPKGKHSANVGIVGPNPNPVECKQELIKFMKSEKGLEKPTIDWEFSKPGSTGLPRLQYNNNKMLLIGDAGGFCDAFSTGGIGFGLLSAKRAIESIEEKNPAKAFYEKNSELVKKLEKSYYAANWFYFHPERVKKLFGEAKKIENEERKAWTISTIFERAFPNFKK